MCSWPAWIAHSGRDVDYINSGKKTDPSEITIKDVKGRSEGWERM
jgi:hypothetical protein